MKLLTELVADHFGVPSAHWDHSLNDSRAVCGRPAGTSSVLKFAARLGRPPKSILVFSVFNKHTHVYIYICVCVPVTIENGKLLRFQRETKSKAAPSPFLHNAKMVPVRLLLYVCDLCHQWSVRPPATTWQRNQWRCHQKQSKQPYPPDSHMGSWVGWVETGRMLSFLQVHKDQRQREGVFQSCKICGKSLKDAKIE